MRKQHRKKEKETEVRHWGSAHVIAVVESTQHVTAFKNEKCHVCSKIGHIACACRKGKATSQTQYVETEQHASRREDDDELFGVYAIYSTSGCEKEYTVDVALRDKIKTMLLDTGSAVSVISDKYYQTNFSHFPLISFQLKAEIILGPKDCCQRVHHDTSTV